MSYHGHSHHGHHSQMPMPMHSNSYTSTASSMPYPPSTSGNPYPTSQQQFYPPSSQLENQQLSELNQWMEELIANLSSMLKGAQNDELEQLVNNDAKLTDLVQQTEEIKKLKRKREELVTENKDQAVTNMTMEPEIDIRKTALVDVANKQNELHKSYLQLKRKLGEKALTLDSTLACLQVATAEAESESDTVSQEFLDGSRTVDDFVENFIAKRTLYHLRKLKSEKMPALLQSGSTSVNRTMSLPQPTAMPRPTPIQRPTPTPRPVPSSYVGYGGY